MLLTQALEIFSWCVSTPLHLAHTTFIIQFAFFLSIFPCLYNIILLALIITVLIILHLLLLIALLPVLPVVYL